MMDYISQVEDVHYWQHQRLNIITANEKTQRSAEYVALVSHMLPLLGENVHS